MCNISIYYIFFVVITTICYLTISNLSSLLTRADIAKVTTVQAAKAKYVFMTARCWSSPRAKALLNEGQNIHKNIVPENIPKGTEMKLKD